MTHPSPEAPADDVDRQDGGDRYDDEERGAELCVQPAVHVQQVARHPQRADHKHVQQHVQQLVVARAVVTPLVAGRHVT